MPVIHQEEFSEKGWRQRLINGDFEMRRKGGVLGPAGKSETRSTKIVCPECGSASCGEVHAGNGVFSIAPEPVERRGATVRETWWMFTCRKGKCSHTFTVRVTLALGRITNALHEGDRRVVVHR